MAVTHSWQGRRFVAHARKHIERGLLKVAITAEADLKKELSHAGGGRKHPGLKYRSSAPGQSPAVQTGRLRAQHTHDTRHLKARNPRVRAGTNVRYARWLHDGTRFIKPRPWMKKVALRNRRKYGRIFSGEMRMAVRSFR